MTKARDLGDNALNTKPKVVDAKGDLIVGTAADTADRLAVGSNGDSLVADSTATTGLRWASTPSASNPVINSAFDIWQRGTSDFTPLNASFVYTADRWSCFRSAGSSGALVKYVSSTGLAGIPNAARMQRTSGNTSTDGLYLLHNLETRDSTRFQGKTVTMSFYARAGANFSGSNSNIAFFMYSGTGTDLGGFSSGWTGAAAIVDTTSATLTTSWARYTATGTVSSSANQIGMVFYYAGVGTAGANDYFDITGVQIDVGNVALPYRRTSANLQGELAACQRYYEVGSVWREGTNASSGNYCVFSNSFLVQKRANATMTFGNVADANANITSIDGPEAIYSSISPFSKNNLQTGFAFRFIPSSTTSTIRQYWTASAEL